MSDGLQQDGVFSHKKRQLWEQWLSERGGKASPARKISPRRQAGPVPMSYAQQRLWFLYHLESVGVVYNVPFAFRIKGPLDLDALRRSFVRLAQRHEILRTRFKIIDGQPMQIIEQDPRVVFLVLDVRSFPAAQIQAQVQENIIKEAHTPFDLQRTPLWRVKVLRVDELEYLLLLNFHHIIFDEWSQGIFFSELNIIYQAECQGVAPRLEEVELHYADFALWQIEFLKSDEVQAQLGYWKDKLAAFPSVSLPLDYPRPAVQSFRGSRVRGQVTAEVAGALRQLSQSEQVTYFATLLSAFFVLLQRYTGQNDLLVGTPVANRNHLQLEKMIGFFLNTLVIRADLSGSPTFRQTVSRVGSVVLEALANQDLPFERLVDELKIERSLSHHPIFQIAFAYHPRSSESLALANLHVTPMMVDFGWAKFDLTLFVNETEEGLRLSLEYSQDLFKPNTIERMMRHLCSLLTFVAHHPDTPICCIPLLSDEERRTILQEWNNRQRMYPGEVGVHRLVEQRVALQPHAPALEFGTQRWSYAELNACANQLARYLIRLGLKREEGVAVCMPRNAEMVLAWLAILKAGGVYIPLDETYPAERLNFMLKDSKARMLIALGEKPTVLPEKVTLIDLHSSWEEILKEGSANLDIDMGGEGLAYIMYTSGSTGEPKGIGIPHRAINRLVVNSDYKTIEVGERVAQASNASFDAATFEVWGALVNGGVVVGVQKDELLDVEQLTKRIRAGDIQVLFLTTALFNQIAAVKPEAFSGLNCLLFGGEAVSPAWVRAVMAVGAPQRFLHVYGPTESTTFATWHEVRTVPDHALTIPIGTPIANTRVYVLDEHLQPVPLGVAGELYIGGDGLARGYSSRPRETAEKFLPDPFAGVSGARMYATGDVVRWNEAGEIEFIGRRDTQVKLRGFRIELGEVEAAILRQEEVKQVVAMVREDRPGDKRLVAYVVAEEALSEGDLRQRLKALLPEYMLPSAVVFMEKLPLNPNGKVDRQALPPPTKVTPSRTYLPARDEYERSLVEIWQQVLGLKEISVEDNFFDLGGNSLLAIQLFSLIEERFERTLPLATLFHHPTIAALAVRLQQEEDLAQWSTVVNIQPHGDRPPFFCVHTFGGEVVNFAPLASFLGEDQPFYGLQARGIDGKQEPHTTIEEMAAYYIRAMRSVQAQGPYYIGGYCFGGIVAYEMACQLQALGEEVALVAIIDAYAPLQEGRRKPKWNLRRVAQYILNLPIWIHDFVAMGEREMLVVVKRRLKILQKQMRHLLGKPMERLTPQEVIGMDLSYGPAHRVRLMELHMRAILDYRPQLYAGEVTVLRVRRMPLFKLYDHDVGWSQIVTGGVKVRIVPGAHHNILEAGYARDLAKELRAALDEAIERTHRNKTNTEDIFVHAYKMRNEGNSLI